MILVGTRNSNVEYSDRKSSYGILLNEKGQIAIVHHINWGLIFPGGKIEKNETSDNTIKRETLEEIGYDVSNLKYYQTMEAYYEVTSSNKEYMNKISLVEIGNLYNANDIIKYFANNSPFKLKHDLPYLYKYLKFLKKENSLQYKTDK